MKAPQKSTIVTKVIPGQTKARIPNRIATIPRSRISHQYFASTGRMGAPMGAVAGEGAVDMSNLPFVSRPSIPEQTLLYITFAFGGGALRPRSELRPLSALAFPSMIPGRPRGWSQLNN